MFSDTKQTAVKFVKP